jgi:hypothetical protein
MMFRSESNIETGQYYLFAFLRLSGAPAWDIEFYKDGRYSANITGLKYATAIKLQNGATNNIIIIAEGNKFTVYINSQRIGTFYDYSELRIDGRFAFAAVQETGESTCKFENSWVWLLK